MLAFSSRQLTYGADGAQLFDSALDEAALASLAKVLADLPVDRAGIRLHGIDGLSDLLEVGGPIGAAAACAIGRRCKPVRAILFDKSPCANWALGWHQDRTIAVAGRRHVAGFGPWTVKQGLHHVEPPFDLLASMVTLRIHLDPVSAENAPLLVAPGSHRFGRVSEKNLEAAVARCGTIACLADAGDIWLYATPILHASDAAREPSRRRVLQIDYAARDLPGGLDWLGV